MSPTYSPSRPLRLDQVERWDIETDVAVVGFGISGACAAIEAKTAGATGWMVKPFNPAKLIEVIGKVLR